MLVLQQYCGEKQKAPCNERNVFSILTINMLEKLTVDQIQSFTSSFHEGSGIRVDLDFAEELLTVNGIWGGGSIPPCCKIFS